MKIIEKTREVVSKTDYGHADVVTKFVTIQYARYNDSGRFVGGYVGNFTYTDAR